MSQFMTTSSRASIAACILAAGFTIHLSAQNAPADSNRVTAPSITAASALNDAIVVTLSQAMQGATIRYTIDASAPNASSPIYEAPFLVASNLTVQAIAVAPGGAISPPASKTFAPNIPPGTLVWSDEFSNATGVNAQPDPTVWTYDTGSSGWGNNELEEYCAWGSSISPCASSDPSAYVGTDGYLHIVAAEPSPGVYTSARLKTKSLFSFRYGRIEFRAQVPEAQGFWPAAWLLGNNLATAGWPACGEMDVLERVNAAAAPDWNEGSVHGAGFIGTHLGTRYNFASGQTAAGWHTYGMIWNKGSVAYYVDNPDRPYIVYTPSSIAAFSGSIWPFDSAQASFIILNLAVGGAWPGPPSPSTPFPSQMLVDYVRIYTN